MLELLKESLRNARVMRRGEYRYFIHPLTDSIPPIKPELMREVCEAIASVADTEVDCILTMEAMGIHIAAVLSQLTDLPFSIVRKRQYGLPGEVILDHSTGYSKGKMYVNSIKKGDRILVVDAVVSTGGTLVAVLNALEKIGAEVRDIVCVIERGDGVRAVRDKTGFEVKTLVKIEVDEKVHMIDSID